MGCEILTFNEVKKKNSDFFLCSVVCTHTNHKYFWVADEKKYLVYLVASASVKLQNVVLNSFMPQFQALIRECPVTKLKNSSTACIAFFGNKQATFISVSHI